MSSFSRSRLSWGFISQLRQIGKLACLSLGFLYGGYAEGLQAEESLQTSNEEARIQAQERLFLQKRLLAQEKMGARYEALRKSLASVGFSYGDDVFLRIIKARRHLELWMRPKGSQLAFKKVKIYRILALSGKLGPKKQQGDLQAPEGFYEVTQEALNPKSQYYLSFDIGYPNAFDRSMGYTGSLIMVHGDAKSRGCFAIGDEGIKEVYLLVQEALKYHQKIAVHVYPFDFTPSQMQKAKESPHYKFWCFLSHPWHYMERTKRLPSIEHREKSLFFKEGGLSFTPENKL